MLHYFQSRDTQIFTIDVIPILLQMTLYKKVKNKIG